MTFVNRLLNFVGLLTVINIKKRPYLEIQPVFGSDSFRIPMALYSDLFESLSLINNSTGGIRAYVLDWYQNVFLNLYGQKLSPNSKEKNDKIVTEEMIAVTTKELIEETYKVMNKHYTSKNILTEFLYPLLNLGYIDSIHSLVDGRAFIYFPVLDIANEKNINLFLFNKKNNLFDEKEKNKLIYSCYFCNFKSTLKEVKRHCVFDQKGKHNGRIAYFYPPEFEKYGIIHHDDLDE